VRGGGQGGCRTAAGEEEWGGCRARRAWWRAGAWACTMCQAGRLEKGPAFSFRVLDAEASFGRRCEFGVICLVIRTRAGWQSSSSNRDVAGPRGCSTREGRHSGGRSLVGATRRASWGRQEAGRLDRCAGCRGVRVVVQPEKRIEQPLAFQWVLGASDRPTGCPVHGYRLAKAVTQRVWRL